MNLLQVSEAPFFKSCRPHVSRLETQWVCFLGFLPFAFLLGLFLECVSLVHLLARASEAADDSYALPVGVNPRFAAVYTPILSPPESSRFLYPTYDSRGVSKGKATSSSGSRRQAFFACPSSGGDVLIPWEMINDGFCDCRGDGADEPGTDACGGIVPFHTRRAERFRASVHAAHFGAASQRGKSEVRDTPHERGKDKVTVTSSGGADSPAGTEKKDEEAASTVEDSVISEDINNREKNKQHGETQSNGSDESLHSFVEADGDTDSICQGFAGDCGDKKFRRLKGAFGFFCGSSEGEGRAAGRPRVISPLKVHDGICDCCDGSDEAPDASLLSLSAVGYRPYFPYFPFSSSFPYAPDESSTVCPNVCEKEVSEWQAAVKESRDELTSVESLLTAQQRKAEELLRRRLEEEKKVENEISKIKRIIDCKWLEAEAKQRKHKAHLHDSAMVHKAVQRAVIAAKGGEQEQRRLKEEDSKEIEEEQELLYCEKLLKQHAREYTLGRHEEPEDKDGAARGSQQQKKSLSEREMTATQHGGSGLVESVGQSGKEQSLSSFSEDAKRAARVAQKARAARDAAAKAYDSREMDRETEEKRSSVSPPLMSSAWDSVWGRMKSAADRVMAAVEGGLRDIGLLPGIERKSPAVTALTESLETLQQQQRSWQTRMENSGGLKALLAPLHSTCLFTFDVRRRFDYRLCLFDKVEQYFHRPDRAQKALAAFQELSPAERESLKLDVSSFTGGPPGEQVFLLGKFKSLDAVNCPREDKADKRRQEKGVQGQTGGGRGRTQGDSKKRQKQAKEQAVKGKDEETSAAEGVAGISVRPEEEKKDEKEKAEEKDEEDEEEEDGDDDESLVTSRPRYCFEMIFVDGTNCTPELARETRVLIYCGSELAVLEVTEPSPCRYNVLLTTPLLCLPEQVAHKKKKLFNLLHDEL
ncbi:glucosidase ii beta subunit-like protein [Cystoisospora suis]|uniref:Glucosidase ii beta subunit-like protein n=1 Tax=Cystoisospora suis TaxID=483139 RepID=A0A2C6KPB9_9APIC|nr:glucosidase ii beta subunit-like protein [Cystoisospora suis]